MSKERLVEMRRSLSYDEEFEGQVEDLTLAKLKAKYYETWSLANGYPVEWISAERGQQSADDWGFNGMGWYFWEETWADAHGPYDTEQEARDALLLYTRLYL